MSAFFFKVGDRVTNTKWEPDSGYIQIEWIGDGYVAGMDEDGNPICLLIDNGGIWSSWVERREWKFITEYRVPKKNERYLAQISSTHPYQVYVQCDPMMVGEYHVIISTVVETG